LQNWGKLFLFYVMYFRHKMILSKPNFRQDRQAHMVVRMRVPSHICGEEQRKNKWDMNKKYAV
jgi:hypothetical protein